MNLSRELETNLGLQNDELLPRQSDINRWIDEYLKAHTKEGTVSPDDVRDDRSENENVTSETHELENNGTATSDSYELLAISGEDPASDTEPDQFLRVQNLEIDVGHAHGFASGSHDVASPIHESQTQEVESIWFECNFDASTTAPKQQNGFEGTFGYC